MSCFLTHKWSNWSAPFPATMSDGCNAMLQEKTCDRCGKMKFGRMFAPGFGPIGSFEFENKIQGK